MRHVLKTSLLLVYNYSSLVNITGSYIIFHNVQYGVCVRAMGLENEGGGGEGGATCRSYSRSGSGGILGLTLYIKILGMSRQNIFNMFNTNSYL